MVAGPWMCRVGRMCVKGRAMAPCRPALPQQQPAWHETSSGVLVAARASSRQFGSPTFSFSCTPAPQAHVRRSLLKASKRLRHCSTWQQNKGTMQLVQQRPGALAAPTRVARPGLRAAPRPAQLAGAPVQRTSTRMLRREHVHKQAGRRCAGRPGQTFHPAAAGQRRRRQYPPGGLPWVCPAHPAAAVHRRDVSSVTCRYLRGSSGPVGRPWVAIAAVRRGGRIVVSATLVRSYVAVGVLFRC